MSQDAPYFRDRAEHCRALAKATFDKESARLIQLLAEDFEEEARRLELEARDTQSP